MPEHHVTVEAQTWGNVAPYPPKTMYRAKCKCGWRDVVWYAYAENVPKTCGQAETTN